MARMTDDELRALTDAKMQDAIGFSGSGGKLEAKRRKNLSYFLAVAEGDLAPPEIDGRSSVVATTVRDTILGMEAPLIKKFCGTANAVEFSETAEGDEGKAKQATGYLNYLLRKKNPGYSIVTTWVRDALVQKFGFVKVWWDDSAIESKEEYRGQTDVQLAILLDDDEVEPIAQKSYPDPDAEKQHAKTLEQMRAQLAQMQQAGLQLMQGGDQGAIEQAGQQYRQAQAQMEQFAAQPTPQLYDVTVKRVKDGGRLCIENVPPEEMLVPRDAKSLSTLAFIGHRVRRTISQLKAAGYSNVDDIASDDAASFGEEAVARREYDTGSELGVSGGDVDPGMREVWITECYVKCDYDGDGLAAWRKVVRAGNQILENAECDDHPFVGWCPVPMPHRLIGLCPADLAMESQRIKTSLRRAQLDNTYLQVNGRYFAVEGQVNLDDLLSSRPGGVVRVKNTNSVGRLDQGAGDVGGAMQLMESIELDAEEATGWTRQSQGGNGLGLDGNSTLGQANIVTNRADSRVEIIARQFAETGYTDLFRRMLKLVLQYQNRAEMIRLGDKWENVDPREWTNQFDMEINVGIGAGNKDQEVQHLMALKQAQAEGLQIGICTPKNVYAADMKLAEALGFKSGGQFFHDPDAPPDPNAPPPPPPPPDPNLMKLQQQDQQHQRELAFKAQQAEADRQHAAQVDQLKSQMQMEVDRNRQEAEAQQKLLEIQQQAQLEQLKEQYRHEQENSRIELERWKAQLASDTQIYIAQMNNQAAAQKAQLAADRAQGEAIDGN
jgi:hypothetical protein